MSNKLPLDTQRTIANVVLEFSECAPVFQKHRIDYCCKGNISIEEAASKHGLELDSLMAELTRAIEARSGNRDNDPQGLPSTALIAYIISNHHNYLREALPFVQGLASKVARVRGQHNPKLVELNEVVEKLSAALIEHVDDEEQVLFPALMSKNPDPRVLADEFKTMQDDHLAVGALLEQMRDATEDYTLPEWACTSYRTLFAELEVIEGDTLRHVHLETHALMPRFEGAVA